MLLNGTSSNFWNFQRNDYPHSTPFFLKKRLFIKTMTQPFLLIVEENYILLEPLNFEITS